MSYFKDKNAPTSISDEIHFRPRWGAYNSPQTSSWI